MVQINNLPYIPVRVKFRKVGDLQYISHLDLVRTMQRVSNRAKLPLWYTEGFNPKPKMVFGPPLSTGVESECEFLDLRFTESVDFEEIKLRLNENLTDSMRVYDAGLDELICSGGSGVRPAGTAGAAGNGRSVCVCASEPRSGGRTAPHHPQCGGSPHGYPGIRKGKSGFPGTLSSWEGIRRRRNSVSHIPRDVRRGREPVLSHGDLTESVYSDIGITPINLESLSRTARLTFRDRGTIIKS